MNPVQAAQQAIQGLSPSQAPAAPTVNTAMPSGLNAQGAVASISSATPISQSPFAAERNAMFNTQQAAIPGELNAFARQANAATQASNNYYDWQQQHQQNIANLQNQIQQNNPANYKKAPGQDGGFNFTDPTGKSIPVWQYSQATGQDVTTALSGSTNPVDKQYIQDHTQLESLLNAYAGGSQQDQDSAAKKAGFTKGASDMHTQLAKLGINGPDDLVHAFMQSYPNIWGQGLANSSSVGNQRLGGAPFYGGQ